MVAPVPEDEEERQEAPWSAHHPVPEGHQERSPAEQVPAVGPEVPEAQEARAARMAPEVESVPQGEPAEQREQVWEPAA